MTPYLSPTPSGNLTPCLPNPNYFYCLISRGVCGMTHNQISLLFLALSLTVGFSATLLTSSPVNQIIARDPRALLLLVSLQAFGHSNFQGIICKAEKTSTVPFMLSPSLSVPWGQLFYLREPYWEISNSIALYFWPLISDTYSCLIMSCGNSQEKNEIVPSCRCQLLAEARAGCTLLSSLPLFYAVSQPVRLEVCFCEIQTWSYLSCEFTRSGLA